MQTTPEQMRRLYLDAQAAGKAAVESASVQEIQVYAADLEGKRIGPLSEPFPICGFAWVTVRPGNSRFANWLKKTDKASPAYRGGVQIWVSDYEQSYDRKLAHAQAMARVLSDNGINASASGRLD